MIIQTLLLDPVVWSSLLIIVLTYCSCVVIDLYVVRRRLLKTASPNSLSGNFREPLTTLGSKLTTALIGVEYRLTSLEWQVDAQTETKRARARAEALVEIADSPEVPSQESLIGLLLAQNEPRFRGSFLAVALNDGAQTALITNQDRGPAFNTEVKRYLEAQLYSERHEALGNDELRHRQQTDRGLQYYGITHVITSPFSYVQNGAPERGALFVGYQAPDYPTTIEAKWAEELSAELKLRLTATTRIREAESLSQEKSEFLAHMSHDIRAPLNNIGNVLHLLRDDIKGAEELELLDIAHANCTAMRDLIEAILDYSRLRAGKLQAERELTDLKSLLTDVSECYAVQARLRELELSLTLPEEKEVRALVDARQIKRVVSNLIGNAIKFTPKGGAVNISIVSTEEGISISVQDTGVGMSGEQLTQLFSPFKRFHGASVDGIGLGLVLSKTLMELNGGDIEVESQERKGTVFTVRIPALNAQLEEPEVSSDEWGELDSLLIVDDDVDAVNSLARVLENQGFDVTRAASVTEALGVLNFAPPKVVITDAHMPGGGGVAVLKKIRKDHPEVLSIVVSGSEDGGEIRELRALGAGAVLQKPVDGTLIMRTIERLSPGARSAVG
jgi:signal transduction histidine kinase/ActR/RegA family two-component response regulator